MEEETNTDQFHDRTEVLHGTNVSLRLWFAAPGLYSLPDALVRLE